MLGDMRSHITKAIKAAGAISGTRATKANLARVLGVHRSAVTRYEQGAQNPSRRVVVMLRMLVTLQAILESMRVELADLRS